jgi:hypothetical protein
MRAVRVGGIWLHSIGPYADVTTSHIWPHGDDEASWRMRPTTSHPVLSRGGALVEVFNGGRRCWRGHLTEPGGSGEYHANGSWSEATGVYAINSSGDATNDLNEAVDVAIAAGKVSWTRPVRDSAGGSTRTASAASPPTPPRRVTTCRTLPLVTD